ncbi:MAG: hypothetical protein HXX19_20750, partial [Rhodoferax sp.]|nr:hypothetical protein [Rhodoferax sp.]
MSLITQCPACATMFRVVPDQLRISEGWVRCGQCEEVFDANAHLRSAEAAQPQPQDAQPLSEETRDPTLPARTPPSPPAPDPYDWGPVLAPQEPDVLAPEPLDQVAADSVPDAQSEPVVGEPYWDAQPLPEGEALQRVEPEPDAFMAQVPPAPLADELPQESPPMPAPPDQAAAYAQDHAEVSFMAPPMPLTPARRKAGTYNLGGLCVLLVLLLGLLLIG